MKVKIKNENKSTEIKYPCLMISELDSVILFTSPKVGVLVVQGKSSDSIGEHHDDWEMEEMKPFTGTIELSNE